MSLDNLEKILTAAEFHPRQGQQVDEETEKTEEKPDETGKKLEEINRKLSETNGAQQQSQLILQQVMADPDIAKVLKARSEGRKVVVNDEGETRAAETEIEEKDLDDPKKLAAYLLKQADRSIDARLEAKLAPLKESLQRRAESDERDRLSKMTTEVEELRSTNNDFDALLPTMKEINLQTKQTLGPKELLILARAKSGSLGKPGERRSTESERPTSEATRPSMTDKKSNGPKTLRSALDMAYDRAAARTS